jgi:hypothetical protein
VKIKNNARPRKSRTKIKPNRERPDRKPKASNATKRIAARKTTSQPKSQGTKKEPEMLGADAHPRNPAIRMGEYEGSLIWTNSEEAFAERRETEILEFNLLPDRIVLKTIDDFRKEDGDSVVCDATLYLQNKTKESHLMFFKGAWVIEDDLTDHGKMFCTIDPESRGTIKVRTLWKYDDGYSVALNGILYKKDS